MKMRDKIQRVGRTIRHTALWAVLSGILVFAGVSYAAANIFLSTEAESGARTTNAGVVADTSAAGSLAIKFSSIAAPALMGWQITSTNVGLAPFGLSCASLPLYTGSMAPAAGTTISQKRINGFINASAGNITIEKSCIQPSSGSDTAFVDTRICGANECTTPNTGVIVRDSESDASLLPASSIAGTCAFLGNGTAQRNYMHGMGSGIAIYGSGTTGNALIENNYVTGLRSYGGSHNEAGTVRDFVKDAGDTRTVKWIGNRLDADSGNVTAGLFLQPTWIDIYNVWVTNNYIEGDGYNLYSSGGQTGAHIGNAHAVNNRFRSIGWGPAVVDNVEGWVEWSQNYRYNAADPDGKGAVVPQP